jgi:molybdate transport system ATP-binding protein
MSTLTTRFNLRRDGFRLSVDLALPDQGVTAIFGPSGSGKTTLLRAIAGLEQIPGGQIHFRGQCWQDDKTFLPAYQRPIGFVFQEPSLFQHLDIRGNLNFGYRRMPENRRRIALDEIIALLNIGHLLERRPATLSGGEQQRVAIARTLATSPELLLMDEPLSSLDNKLKLDILPYLERLQSELAIPILYVSHATDEVARLADNLVILKNGEVLGTGAIQEMLTRLDLPLSRRRDAESLLQAEVSDLDATYGLINLKCEDQLFTVSGTDLSIGQHVRLRIAAQDVSLTLAHQNGTSIQNIFPVTVVEMKDENRSQVMVRLKLGNSHLIARITRKSAAELALNPGKAVFAQIKSIAVLA